MTKYTRPPEPVFEPDNLEATIKTQLDQLPEWCECNGNLGHHEWINTYGHYTSIDDFFSPVKGPTKMAPYYLCKHCHAVSNDFTTNPTIKRAR